MLDLTNDERDQFFNLSLDMLCVSSGDGYFKWLNPAFSQTLGWSIEELLTKPYTDFVHPEDLPATIREVQRQVAAGEKVFQFENRYRHKDGSWRVLSWKSVPRGNLMYAVARDVTERTLLQQSLREVNSDLERRVAARTTALQKEVIEKQKAEESFRRLLEAAPDAVVISRVDGKVVSINSQAERLFGYTRAEVINREIDLILPGDSHGRRKDGSSFPIEISVGELETDDGKILLNAVRDTTERRALESQLRQAVKMEAVGQLTGGVAHDFNNLLGVVIGNLDIAMEQAGNNQPLRDTIQDALSGALRGAELTRRLLAFSRNQPLQPAAVDLNKGLPQIASMLRRTLGEQISVELHPAADLWNAQVDPAQLDEAILNLAINARDAMPKGGTLTIETSNTYLDADYASHHAEVAPGDYVLVSVSDTGSGMTAEVIEHCFEPFFTTKGVEKGTGLGLSMVYGFVKQSGGHIKIYSEVGHGTTVKIYLPRAGRGAAQTEPAFAGEVALPSGSEVILMVEDNKDLRTVTAKQLADLGYRTLEADNSKSALQMLASCPEIDLLFTDIIMPGGMTGTELAREARRLYPKLKILLTSGYTARAMANGFHDIEGVELLNKPFRKRDLGLKLRDLLGAR